MSHKSPNPHVACNVDSCRHHCEECDNCSLDGISVEACAGCRSGQVKDESMCASYQAK